MPYPNPSSLLTGLESMTRQIGTWDKLTPIDCYYCEKFPESVVPFRAWILLYFLWATKVEATCMLAIGQLVIGRYRFHTDAGTSIELPHRSPHVARMHAHVD